jgi:Uncharacterized protein conserved in bacteria
MNVLKKTMVFLAVIILLASCSQSAQTQITCVGAVADKDVTLVLSATDDKADKNITTYDYSIAELEISDEEANERLIEHAKQYDVPGVVYTYNIENSQISETIEIDYHAAEMITLISLGLVEQKASDTFISLEQTKTGLTNKGYTCENN